MAQTITVDGVARTSVIRRETCEWTEVAYLGEVGTGKFVVDDESGNLSVVGHKAIEVLQSSSTPDDVFHGFVGDKAFVRDEGANIDTSATARFIEVATKDLNDLLGRRVITGSDGNRPQETIDARLTWLLASDYVAFTDEGAVASSTLVMDKTDYRGQKPGDVLAACAKKANFNYYIRWNPTANGPELVFRDDNASTDDTCTLSISNVLANINSTTVFPLADARLTQTPEHVYSGAYAAYANGVRYVEDATTAAAFVERDGTTDDAGIKTADAAQTEAEQFLDESDSEEFMLTGVLRLRTAKVGLVQAGQRIAVSLSYLEQEGFHAGAYWRILRKRVSQPTGLDTDYDVAIDLSPQETPPAPDICSDLYDETASDTYYPLGGSGKIPNPSDGVVYYYRSGLTVPLVPTPGYVGSWHFPIYGAGGAGSIDIAGDCTQNRLVLMTVGPGTWTIQTERRSGVARAMYVAVGATINSAVTVNTFTSGAVVEVEIDDTEDGDCIRVVVIGDLHLACGSGWGWSEAEWAAS